MSIGIYFPKETKSSYAKTLCYIITAFLNLYSIYFFILFANYSFRHGLSEELLTNCTHVFLATLIHFHFARHSEKLVESFNLLAYKQTIFEQKKKSLKTIILASFSAILLVFILTTILMYSKQKMLEQTRIFMLFSYLPSNWYLLALSDALILAQNWILILIPGLTFVLISFIYYELGKLMHSVLIEMKKTVNKSNDDWQLANHCAYLLCKASNIVAQINEMLTMPLFYLISLFMIQGMVFTTVLAKQSLDTVMLFTLLPVQTGAIFSFLTLIILASRISEIYSKIKNTILTAESVRLKLFAEKTQASSYVGLLQMANGLTDNFSITAMGTIRIEKGTIISVFCAFISYSIILSQMVQKNVKN